MDRCGCENSSCEVVHTLGHCLNPGTVPCMWVGQLCGVCAQYMPEEYLLTEEKKG